MSLLGQITRYRLLKQLSANGGGLGIKEVLAMEAVGASLRAQSGKLLSMSPSAVLSTNTIEHAVKVKRIGPEGLVCTQCPGVLPSATMGLRIDDEESQKSYLFRVSVSWIQQATPEDQCEVGLEFVGSPVVLRRRRARTNSPEAVLEVENKLAA